MSHVVQAVTVRPVAVFPCLPPRNTGQYEYDPRRDSGPAHVEFPSRALLSHVRRGTIVVQAVPPVSEAAGDEVKFGRMEIAGRGIHPQRVFVSGGWNAFGGADRRGIKK